jgi:thiol-disulfide isomerase/thioredoxin
VSEPASTQQSASIPTWALIAAAGALVLGLAFAEQRRSNQEVVPKLALPLLEGGGSRGVEQGKVTLVDFWATWCGPCRITMPRVQKLYSDYGPRGVELLSVDTDSPSVDRDPTVKEFLLQNRLTFPVVLDDGPAQEAFNVQSLPTMLLVSKDGHVLWRHIGVMTNTDEAGLRALIDQSL